jgi:hypothetical protein
MRITRKGKLDRTIGLKEYVITAVIVALVIIGFLFLVEH